MTHIFSICFPPSFRHKFIHFGLIFTQLNLDTAYYNKWDFCHRVQSQVIAKQEQKSG